MNKIKVGFLPLYIKLYDEIGIDITEMVQCMETAVSMIKSEGIDVVCADICRVKAEYDNAVKMFLIEDVDAVITYHLAYSPSLESIDSLCKLNLPIIVCDTTITYDMSARMNSSDIISNHGIHGVMDMCNLLKRNNIKYFVEAGHLLHSDVIARCVSHCRAAKIAKNFRRVRIGSFGGVFEGMGDFLKTPEEMKKELGSEVIVFDFDKDYEKYNRDIFETDIDAEIELDKSQFVIEVNNTENYRSQTRTGLVLRKWVQDMKLNSYTVNFMNMRKTKMPFLEISKAMMNGIGYAGEGDVLTAGLVGALMSVYADVTFTETFCPCWKNGLLFMSHMGEMNMNISSTRPVITDMPFSFTESGDTVAAFGKMREGEAVFVNLAPNEGNKYTLLVTQVKILGIADANASYKYKTEGWMKPQACLQDFLKRYSEIGGTHHSALVYNVDIEELISFGRIMGFDVQIIS